MTGEDRRYDQLGPDEWTWLEQAFDLTPNRSFPFLQQLLANELFHHMITCTPGVRSGKPCLAGTRISVSDVLEYLASGMNQGEILADFPDLKPEHIQAVLRYAAEREKRLSELTVA